MYKYFSLITKKIIDLLYPIECVLCRSSESLICDRCEGKLKRLEKHNDLPLNTFAIYDYKDENVKKIMYSIKYRRGRELAEALGMYHKDMVADILDTDEYIIIPIPISKERYKERGYNQSLHLAYGIDKVKVSDILKRDKYTEKFKNSESVYERLDQIRDSMSVIDNSLDMDTKILIIDDITTSGTTIYEARRALLARGFQKDNIYALAFAH